MRIPDQPPDVHDILKRKAVEFGEALSRHSPYWNALRSIEREYRPWTKTKHKAFSLGLDPELLWAIVKTNRKTQYRFLPLRGTKDPLRFTVPDLLQEELMLIDQQLAGRIISSDDQPLTASHRERFIISALREEAIASSMLEGAATTRKDAKEMLASGRKPRTVGERMVSNNYQAISFIREHRESPLTPEFLLTVQDILTANTLDNPEEAGRFRTQADDVKVVDPFGQVLHTPPPASDLKNHLAVLCAFANERFSKEPFVHPVIRACVLHFQLGFIHPFCDGNGRTARAVFYWAMLRAGYWLFEYLPISRLIYAGPAKYGLAYLYTETDDFDLTYFLVYKAKLIARARKELGEYISRKQAQLATSRKVFETDHRLNHRQRDVILRMLRSTNLSLSIQDHRDKHNVAYATARSDLMNLANWGYLSKVIIGQKRFEFLRGIKIAEPDDLDVPPGTIDKSSQASDSL